MARADGAKMKAIMENIPLHASGAGAAQGDNQEQKSRTARNQSAKDERLVAERRMLEAMRHVVSTLEFHLEELHRTRKIGNEKGLVNQYAIHNALVLLRTKCGVTSIPTSTITTSTWPSCTWRSRGRISNGWRTSASSASSSGWPGCAT